MLGGKVEKAEVSEYGKTEVLVDKTESKLFKDVSEKTICWMSHTDYISQIAPGFEISAHTADCPVATAENADKNLYADSVPPGGTSYSRRNKDAFQLRSWCLWMRRRLEDGCICREYDQRNP